MPKYLIKYSFQGYGETEIEAKNEQEAKELYYHGEADFHDEGDNYEIDTIEKIKEDKHA